MNLGGGRNSACDNDKKKFCYTVGEGKGKLALIRC